MEMKARMGTPKTVKFLLTSGIILDAASREISEIVELCLRQFPELMWEKSFTKELIKEVVNGRHVDLFRLVNEHNTIPHFTDSLWSNHVLMTAVTEWSPRCVSPNASGAAFRMQREIQWFKVSSLYLLATLFCSLIYIYIDMRRLFLYRHWKIGAFLLVKAGN